MIKGYFTYAEFEAGFEFSFCFLQWSRIIRAHLYVSIDILRRIEVRNENATKGFACFWLARQHAVKRRCMCADTTATVQAARAGAAFDQAVLEA